MKKLQFILFILYTLHNSIFAAGAIVKPGSAVNQVVLNSYELNLLNNHIFLYGTGTYSSKWPSGWYSGVTSESLSVALRINSTRQQIDTVCFQARTYLSTGGAYYKIDSTCVPWHITGDGSINNSGYSKVQRTYTDTSTLEAPTWKVESQVYNNATAQSYSGIIWQSSGGTAADIRSTKTSQFPTWTAVRLSDTSQNRPGAPIATNPSAVSATHNSIQYKWNKVKGTRYDVQLALVGNSYSGWTYASDTTFSKAGLAAGTQYKMRTIVRTFFGADTSAEVLRYTAPSYPTQITTTTKTATSLSFKWNKPATATSYVIEYWNGSAYSPLTTVYDTVFTHNSLSAASYNYYRVTAKNVYNEASQSVTFYATTLPQTPATPSTQATSSQKIQLNYSAGTGASSYLIYRSLTTPKVWSLVASTASTQWIDSNLIANTSYSYYIRVRGNLGDTSVASGVANQYTLIQAPTWSASSALSPFANQLSWNAVSGSSQYKIEKSFNNINFSIDTILTGTLWADDSTQQQTVYYKVYAYANGQYSTASSVQTIQPLAFAASSPNKFPVFKTLTTAPYLNPVYQSTELTLKVLNDVLPNTHAVFSATKNGAGTSRLLERFDLSDPTPYSLPLWWKNTFGNTQEGANTQRAPRGNALYLGQNGNWIKIKSLVVDVARSNQWQSDTLNLHELANQNGFNLKTPVDFLWQSEGSQNATITQEAPFIQKFKITTQVGLHGQVTSKSGLFESEFNSDFNLQFVPDLNYIVDSVLVDGVYIGSVNEYTWSALSQNHTLKVTFKNRPLNKYLLSFTHDTHGTTDPVDSVTVWENSAFNVNLIPNTGYTVDSVWVDGVYSNQSNSYLFQNITRNHNLAVHFKKQQFAVNTSQFGCGQITASKSLVLWNDSLKLTLSPNLNCSLDSLKINNTLQLIKSDTLILANIQSAQNVQAWFSPMQYQIQVRKIFRSPHLDTTLFSSTLMKGSDTSYVFASDSIWQLDSLFLENQKHLSGLISINQIHQDHQILSFWSPKTYQLQLTLNGPGLMSDLNTVNMNFFDTLTLPLSVDSSVQIDSILINQKQQNLNQVLFFDSLVQNTQVEIFSSTKKFPIIVQTLAYHQKPVQFDTTWALWGQDTILTIKLDSHFVADSVWLNQNLTGSHESIELLSIKSAQNIIILPIRERLNVNFSLNTSGTGKWNHSQAIYRYGDSLSSKFLVDETAQFDSVLVNGLKINSSHQVHLDSILSDMNIEAYAHQIYFLDSTHHRLRIYLQTTSDTIYKTSMSLFIPVKSHLELSLFNLVDSLAPAIYKGRTWNEWIQYKDETQNTQQDSMPQGIFKLDSIEHNYMIWLYEWVAPLKISTALTTPQLSFKDFILTGDLPSKATLKIINSQGQVLSSTPLAQGKVHHKIPRVQQIQYLVLESATAKWIQRIQP